MRYAGIPIATLTLFACGPDAAGADGSAVAWCRMVVLPRICVRWIAVAIARTAARSDRGGVGRHRENPRMYLPASIDRPVLCDFLR